MMFGLVAGLAVGLVVGLVAGLVAGLWARLAPRTGLDISWASGLAVRVKHKAELPTRGIQVNVGLIWLAIWLGAGLGIGLWIGLVDGFRFGLAAGLAAGLGIELMAGIEGVPPDLGEAVNPRAVLRRDREIMLVLTPLVGLPLGLVAGLLFGLTGGLWLGLGLASLLGLAVAASETRWMSYQLTRTWLATRHRLPWPLMGFFADAHRRGVLRQAGAVYQFRHIELQHRLANRDASAQEMSSPDKSPAADA